MEILRQKYQNKYQGKLTSLLSNLELPFNFIELDMSNINDYYLDKYPKIQVDLVLQKYRNILDTFVFGNSFIGNEYFILRYIVYQLLLYWYILRNEALSNDEQNTCKLEIETQFYFYLNCIYNIKEKFEIFVNYQKKKLKNTILNNVACKQLLSIYKNNYKILEKYCEARGYIVHNTFSIQYINNKSKINVSCFSFKMTSDQVHRGNLGPILFDINPESIKAPIEAIYNLIIECINLFKQIVNIDFNKLMNKFISLNGSKKSFKITF